MRRGGTPVDGGDGKMVESNSLRLRLHPDGRVPVGAGECWWRFRVGRDGEELDTDIADWRDGDSGDDDVVVRWSPAFAGAGGGCGRR